MGDVDGWPRGARVLAKGAPPFDAVANAFFKVHEERRRALFQEGRYYYTKIKNTDLLWFPRASGRTPTAGWNLSGGIRYVMPDPEYTLDTNLKTADIATGCDAKERPTIIGL